MMRRRREEAPTQDDGRPMDEANDNSESDNDLLDQDEQDKLVADIERKIVKQQKQMLQVFTLLCRTTAIASFILVVVDDLTETAAFPFSQRILRFIQGLASAFLQVTTIRFASAGSYEYNADTIYQRNEMTNDDSGGSGDDARQSHDATSTLSSMPVAKLTRSIMIPLIANVLLASSSVLFFDATRNIKAPETLSETDLEYAASSHWLLPVGLLATNLVTLLGALLLRWDGHDSLRQLAELQGATYHYKSL